MGRISALTELSSLASNDYLLVLDSSANIAKKITVANAFGIPELGYTAAGETWVYASATTITVPSNATTKYAAGMIVKFTQSTGGTKYAVIDSLTSTVLTLVMLGGATLANETITSPSYSTAASPLGVGKIGPARRSDGYRAGVIPKATLGTTGNKVISGLGFKPKMVRFTLLTSTDTTSSITGFGVMDDAGTQFTQLNYVSASGSVQRKASGTGNCIGWTNQTTSQFLASYVSMNPDGFTINVDIASSAFDVGYEAYA